MKNFTIKNENNDLINVDLIRYFKFKNDKFLVYTKNELSDNNLIILYLVRIMEELGEPIVQTIRNENDWSTMQGIIKKVIKEIKNGKIELLEDLNYEEIMNIKVSNPRFFKLEPKLVEILGSGYMDGNITDYTDVSLNGLESIDEPLVKEGFDEQAIKTDISHLNLEANKFSVYGEVAAEPENISKINIKPIGTEDNKMVEIPIYEEQPTELSTAPIEQPTEISVSESNIEPIDAVQPVEEKGSTEQNINVVPEVISDEIDYKALYIATKEENESSSQLIEDLMERLMKYQMKYGELED